MRLRMFHDSFIGLFPPRRKFAIKKALRTAEKTLADLLLRFGPAELAEGLSRVGVQRGDTLLVHSSLRYASGFTGGPQEIVECLLRAVGDDGNLLMVSLPFRTSSYEHLKNDPLFDVRRTPSQMGIISEIFRRRNGVRRSVHPTHPVLAFGKDADWLVQDHETSETPCGPGTPFARFRELGGKVLFYDVPFDTFTFIHHIEDLLQSSLPFPVYRDEPMPGRVLDQQGRPMVVPTRVFSELAVTTRKPEVLERRLRMKKLLRQGRVGRTTLMLVTSEDATREALEMAAQGIFFYRSGEGRR
jgi:aminoglycoside 3-N-acetyltransferase